MAELPELWTPQRRAIEQVTDALADGHRRICLAMPTGSGKSRVACEMVRDWLVSGFKVSVLTNRKMLIEQLQNTLTNFGLTFGVRTADAIAYNKLPTNQALQVSSIQTEVSRVLKRKTWQIHAAERVLVDEAHLNAGATAKTLLDLYLQENPQSAYIGLTATPLDIGHVYDHMIVPTTLAELRECGALVCSLHYGPDEPDCKRIKKDNWEYSDADVQKVMQVQRIFGRILDWFNKLNPDHKPTICFAPGVPDSIWLAEHFREAGIEAAHIDGTVCVYKGESYDSDAEVRREIMRAYKAGEVKVLTNRFVLREGIDAPFTEHLILATIFGSLQSYLQSVGRGLRSSPSTGKVQCTIQDHGGNWWRHGSANVDRNWVLGDTEAIIQGIRQNSLREKQEREPTTCPQCRKVLVSLRCSCGFEASRRSRPIIQEDGSLKDLGGQIFKPRFTKMEPTTESKWIRMYHRSRNGKGRTFNQARGTFFYENGYFPPAGLPFMPKNDRDWFRKVKDVPRGDLT